MDFVSILARFAELVQDFVEVDEVVCFAVAARRIERVLHKHLRQLGHTQVANQVAGTSLFPRPPFVQ